MYTPTSGDEPPAYNQYDPYNNYSNPYGQQYVGQQSNNSNNSKVPQYQPYGQDFNNVSPQYDNVEKQPVMPSAGNSEGRFAEASKYRDPIWAVLFFIHLLGVFILMCVMYGKYKDELTKPEGDTVDDSTTTRISLDGKFWGLLFFSLFLSILATGAWLMIMQRYAKQLIWFTLIFSVAMQFFFSIVLFAGGQAGAGVVFLIFALLSCLYVYFVRNRIEFSSVILEMVVAVIRQYKATLYFALGGAIVQGIWLIIWTLAAASTLYGLDKGNASDGARGFCWFLLLVSFFWTSQVVMNVVHVTCAGLLASWYFLFPHSMPQNPTNKAFKRATTTSFGSICLGSLIVAIIKAVRQMIQQARQSQNDFARACAECLISCIDQLVSFFNLYAYTHVAIYGDTYCEAAKATWNLFKSRGFDVIINDDLINGVLILGSALGGFAVGGFAGLIAKASGLHYWYFYAVVGFFIGFAMVACAMSVVESCVAALFVCFAEDPAALSSTKPEEYQTLTGAIQKFYPTVYSGFIH